jgi:Tol biopolymer transport system component
MRQLPPYAISCFALAACSGDLVVLGEAAPPEFHFATPQRIVELSAPAKTDNPCLTGDLLEIYFTSERDGTPADVYSARRASRDEPFGAVQHEPTLSSPRTETSTIISPDGLTFWVGSDRDGGAGDYDVWQATRSSRSAPWSAPFDVLSLNSSAKDLPRPMGEHDQVMPLGSDRDKLGFYQIYFANRSASDAGFDPPLHVPELSFARESTVDGFLTDDGLTLFFVSGPSIGAADLYVSSRKSTSEPFSTRAPLSDLNTTSDERDPWLSPDGTQFYFSSDRAGPYAIYVADVLR